MGIPEGRIRLRFSKEVVELRLYSNSLPFSVQPAKRGSGAWDDKGEIHVFRKTQFALDGGARFLTTFRNLRQANNSVKIRESIRLRSW
jgi:hypothetical protein